MIISLSGRKHCGKSELAKICADNGYVVLSFADSLKDMIAEMLNISRVELQNSKEEVRSIVLDEAQLLIISQKTNIDYNTCKQQLNKEFKSIRELLQFIGTNLIRDFNPNWHIDSLARKIKPNVDYCIDDTRFPNEKLFLETKGAICFFIIRPSNFEISNHSSEVSLKWYLFDNIVINNQKLPAFKTKWFQFLNVLKNPAFINSDLSLNFKDKIDFRDWLKNKLTKGYSTLDISHELHCSRDKIVWWCDKLMLNITREIYQYDRMAFLSVSELNSYAAGILAADGTIKLSPSKNNAILSLSVCDKQIAETVQRAYGTNRPLGIRTIRNGFHKKDGSKTIVYDIDCSNPFVIENIKHWNLKPRKSTLEEIPDIIKEDERAIKHWITGIIDGDGTVYLNKKTLGIIVLGSKEVVEFIKNKCPYKSSDIKRHKNTNLFEIKWFNFNALDMTRWLGDAVRNYGLKRKWSKIETFIGFETKRKTKSKIKS